MFWLDSRGALGGKPGRCRVEAGWPGLVQPEHRRGSGLRCLSLQEDVQAACANRSTIFAPQ